MECYSDVPDTITKMSVHDSVAAQEHGTEGYAQSRLTHLSLL